MGLRFQRRVTLFPGVRLNFSRRGISTTIGPRGASVNFGRSGATLNLGVPGTGLSVRRKLGQSSTNGNQNFPPPPNSSPLIPPPALPESGAREIASAPAAEVTTEGLESLKSLILEARAEREALRAKLPSTRREARRAERRVRNSKHWLWKRFVGKHLQEREADLEVKAKELAELEERLHGAVIDIDFGLSDNARKSFINLAAAFTRLTGAECIWDITAEREVNRRVTRSAAGVSVSLKQVRLALAQDDLLLSDTEVLRFANANGGDLLIYPAFLMAATGKDFGLVDLRDVALAFKQNRFVETRKIPSDATVVDYTWAKVNKSGAKDKRFKGNYRIPIVGYGELLWTSRGGIHEQYMVSNAEKAARFYEAFLDYQKELHATEVDGTTPRRTHTPPAAPAAPPEHGAALPGQLPAIPPESEGLSPARRLALVLGLSVVGAMAWSVVRDLHGLPAPATTTHTPSMTSDSTPTIDPALAGGAAATATQASSVAPERTDAITAFINRYGSPDWDETKLAESHVIKGMAHRYLDYKAANVRVRWFRGTETGPWQLREFSNLKRGGKLEPAQAYQRLERLRRRR